MVYRFLPGEWTERAKCFGDDTDNYDAENFRGTGGRARAARLCTGCPVMAECAAFALTTHAGGYVYAGIPLPQHNTDKKVRARLAAIIENSTKGIAA